MSVFDEPRKILVSGDWSVVLIALKSALDSSSFNLHGVQVILVSPSRACHQALMAGYWVNWLGVSCRPACPVIWWFTSLLRQLFKVLNGGSYQEFITGIT